MKQRIQYLLLAGLIFSLFFFSCKTTGAVDDLPDTQGPVTYKEDLSEPAGDSLYDALAEAEARAREARSWAEYLNGPIHCPNEWKDAEGRFQTASSRKDVPKTKGEVYGRIDEWNGIRQAYDDIFNASFEPFFAEQEAALAKAREKAVEAGAEDLVPDRLAIADGYAGKSKELYEGGDLYGSLNAGKDAWDRYRILETLALAHNKQMEADEYDFFSADPETYMLAAEAGNNSVDLYDEGDLVKSQEQATAALEGFREVIRNGWFASVEEKASVAREWRSAAQEAKADVAVRTDFNAAESVYNQAHVALRAEQYTQAMDLFEQSGKLFEVAHKNAMDKRAIAEEALRRTGEKLAESEELGQYADEIIGGDE